METQLHAILLRQLKRLELNDESFVADSEKWKEFLQKVSKTYTEADQERYLLERSMELSSQEMLALNKQLETAQHIAGLGYWSYDRSKDQILLSKELYKILHFNQNEPAPKFEDFMRWIHEEERTHIRKLIENALTKGIAYESELRMKRPNEDYRWYYVVCRPEESHRQKINTINGIMMDITTRKKAEAEVSNLNQQLVSAARQIGMADIAASTLHNVGNVLNSASVSLDMVHEKIEFICAKEVLSVFNMLKEHQSNFSEYLTQDPKGKIIPYYLAELADPLENMSRDVVTEINEIRKQLEHIKDIIATQMDIGHSSGMVEKIILSTVIDSALQLSDNSRQFKDIAIHKKYEKMPPIFADKTKLLQILVNIIQNAKESVIIHDGPQKEIHLSMKKDPLHKSVLLSIKDNGIGILPENLIKIFSFGFSTKERGHGYGLHSSILAAQEMGGNLEAQSEGIGKGAVFNLTLPLNASNK